MKRWAFAFVSILMSFGLVNVQEESALATSQDRAFHFGFKRSENGQLPSINEEGFKDIIDRNHAVFLGDTKQKEIYLTFDNGYENGYTTRILDTLKEKKVPAIFFITGHYVKDQPELVKRMVAEGHLIGNHSWSHPDMSAISDAQIQDELKKVHAAVTKVTGVQQMDFVRPPRGIFSDRALRVSQAAGYRSIFWSAAYKDWDTNDQKGADYAYRKVMEQLHPGEVLLLHSVSKDNTEALGRIIDDIRKKGYVFKALTELPGSQANQLEMKNGLTTP